MTYSDRIKSLELLDDLRQQYGEACEHGHAWAIGQAARVAVGADAEIAKLREALKDTLSLNGDLILGIDPDDCGFDARVQVARAALNLAAEGGEQ